MDTAVYYIWLSLRCGAGSEAPSFLLSHFGTPKAIYEADEDALSRALPGRGGLAAALCDKDMETAKKVYDYCLRANVGIILPLFAWLVAKFVSGNGTGCR